MGEIIFILKKKKKKRENVASSFSSSDHLTSNETCAVDKKREVDQLEAQLENDSKKSSEPEMVEKVDKQMENIEAEAHSPDSSSSSGSSEEEKNDSISTEAKVKPCLHSSIDKFPVTPGEASVESIRTTTYISSPISNAEVDKTQEQDFLSESMEKKSKNDRRTSDTRY